MTAGRDMSQAVSDDRLHCMKVMIAAPASLLTAVPSAGKFHAFFRHIPPTGGSV